MIKRELFNIVFSSEWGSKMRFITGPRQAGKTTLSKQKLGDAQSENLYYLWDLRTVRNRYRDNELFFTGDADFKKKNQWVCFDEIHKMPKWKNILKAIYDTTGDRFSFIVTGSAKLNLVKRAGDSLAGRYFTFHLMPLTIREVADSIIQDNVSGEAGDFIRNRLSSSSAGNDAVETLLRYGGFPEPFVRQSDKFYRKWSVDYLENVITEDIGTLTRIAHRESVYELYNLLPEMTGSPVSENSLASHLQISPVTVKNYLKRLEDFYLGFSIRPYSANIKRSLIKARKFYLFNWPGIKDPAKRYEAFTACQIRVRLQLWSEFCGIPFELFYVRNKQKQETDFLILRDGRPWMLIEAKLTDSRVDKHHIVNSDSLGGIPLVQLCCEPGVASQQNANVYRISCERLLG